MNKYTMFTAVTGGPAPSLGSEYNPFEELAEDAVEVEFGYQMHPNGFLVLWGGEDISPALYNHVPVGDSGPEYLSFRDRKEYDLVQFAKKHSMPIIGVCRGAQFLCAMAGGSLFQDVTGHAGPDHAIRVMETDELVLSNSYHHQMLSLIGTDYKMIAFSEDRLSQHYLCDPKAKDTWPLVEPEIVTFNKGKWLAIQGHPEWMESDSRFVQLCLSEARKVLGR